MDLGEQMAGTLCSRSLRQCGSSSSCRIQSPGYPGLYPRSAHCLYRVSAGKDQRRITLWQSDRRKINLRDPEQPTIQQPQQGRPYHRSVAECEASGDYVTIYDGSTTNSPILARFCDGPLPEVTSSGGELTVEFRSSPLDTIYAPSTGVGIEGFELNVRISPGSTAQSIPPVAVQAAGGKCQWNVTSSGLSRGLLTPPSQTWPLQTTCHFRFQVSFIIPAAPVRPGMGY